MRQTLLSLLAARQQGRADLLLEVFSQAEESVRADVGQVSILPESTNLQQVGRCPFSRRWQASGAPVAKCNLNVHVYQDHLL